MKISNFRTTLTIATIALFGLCLAGCAASDSSETSSVGETSEPVTIETEAPETIEAEAPEDLIGEWTQTNKQSEDNYQVATITANEIAVFWVSNGGDSKSLYWAGTYEAPASSGSFVWDSENDTSQTDNALLASGAPTKTFTFEGDEISYEVTALGTTTTVRLGRD